ncbi:MAG: hypothetical protein ABI263_02200 [Gelidibacter sp.]
MLFHHLKLTVKFIKLKLYTHKLDYELKFYSETLGFEILQQNKNSFSVKVAGANCCMRNLTKNVAIIIVF